MASLLASILVALLSLIFSSLATAVDESLASSASPPHHHMVHLSPPPPPPHHHHQHDRTHGHDHSRDHDKDDPPQQHHHHHHDKHTHELFLRPRYGRCYRSPREPLLPPYPRRRSRPTPRIVVPPYIHPHKPRNKVAPPRHAHKYVPPRRKVVPPNGYGRKRRHKTPPRGKKRGDIHRFPRPQHREERRHSRHEKRPVPRKHWTPPYHKSFSPQPHQLQPRQTYHHDRRKARKPSPLKRRQYHGKGKLLGKRRPFPPHHHEKKLKRRRKKHHRHPSGAEVQHKHSLMAQHHQDRNPNPNPNPRHSYYQNDRSTPQPHPQIHLLGY